MKKTRVIGLAVAAAAVAAIIFGIAQYISWDNSMAKQQVDMYFINADGTGIEAEQHVIRYQDENDLIRNTMSELMGRPSGPKRSRIIPSGTDIRRILLEDGNIIVDFSKEFLTTDSSRNVLAVYAVVKTLYSTGHARLVQVTVEDSKIKDQSGTELGFISALDINLETEEYISEMRRVRLYFGADDDKLISEDRTVKMTDQQPIEQYIINELIKGPKAEGTAPLLSKKTVLMSVNVEGNNCFLNFKSGFLTENDGSPEHERLVIYSIVNSLTELESIARVQFLMDGKRVESFGSVRIKDYISRDETLIAASGL